MRITPFLSIVLCACGVGAVTGGGGGGSGGGGGGGGSGGGGGVAGRIRISGPRLVDDNGATVRLTGVNWFGLETSNYAPHGLWTRSMDSMLDQIASLGFNAIRVPFCTQLFDAGATPNGIDFTRNADLVGKTGPEILDILITKATARGLRIILDRHRPDSGAQSPLWYTAQYSEARWIADWVMLAQTYRDNPAVVAFDLHNEPHGQATWGDNNMATDWRLAATRACDAILGVDPDALCIVEGIEVFANNYYWWGGNLRGAASAPVHASLPDHVIYSPHDYPGSVYMQSWFSDAAYPANLPALWDATWGNLAQSAPVLVGEFGTKLITTIDRQWLQTLTKYIQTKGLSFTFWSLNPDSGDTGGILADDWTTVNQDKMGYLTPILAHPLPVH
jgi:endoglucanase